MSLNRTQIISLVLARLGRRGSDTFLSDQAELELGLIQSRLENDPAMMGMWFLLSGETTIATTVANTRTVDLPADFIAEWDGSKLAVYDSTADDPYVELNNIRSKP